MRYIGLGYSVTNNSEIESTDSAFPETNILEMTHETHAIAQEVIGPIYKKRGEFISRSVDIEYLLCQSISDFFFENDLKRKDLFYQHIISQPFFMFNEKKKILQSIMEKYPDKFPAFDKKETKELFICINKIIDIRNAFAHGQINVNVNTRCATLYFFDSKRNRQAHYPLTQSFFNELNGLLLLGQSLLSKCSYKAQKIALTHSTINENDH